MLTSLQLSKDHLYREHSEGQIALERALFCLDCELIFAGIGHYPRCANEAVWPLTQWLPLKGLSTLKLPAPAAGPQARTLRIVYLEEDVSNR